MYDSDSGILIDSGITVFWAGIGIKKIRLCWNWNQNRNHAFKPWLNRNRNQGFGNIGYRQKIKYQTSDINNDPG